MAVAPVPAAIVNAIYDACGLRMRDLPITKDKMLQALRQRQ